MKIGLQNFQGVAEYTEIPLAPITLFYGPNSAGKSTIVDALEFLRGVLSNLDTGISSQRLERHARKGRITHPIKENYKGRPDDVVITVNHFFKSFDYSYRFNHCEWNDAYEVLINKIPFFNADVAQQFEYQIFFSKTTEKSSNLEGETKITEAKWYLRQTILLIDDVPIFRALSDGDDDYDHAINAEHPSFAILEGLVGGDLDAALSNVFADGRIGYEELGFEDKPDTIDYGIENVDKTPPSTWISAMTTTWFPPVLSLFEIQVPITDDGPSLDGFKIRENSDVVYLLRILLRYPPQYIAEELLSFIKVKPIRNYETKFKNLSLDGPGIGPGADPWNSIASAVLYKFFQHKNGHCLRALDFVNRALLSPNLLDTGYSIAGDVDLSLGGGNTIAHISNKSPKALLKQLQKQQASVHLYLVDEGNKLPVEIVDVGVGISQVIPVLWGCCVEHLGDAIIHIQQPEVHLHPKMQAQLGDVFIESIRGRRTEAKSYLLLESHSEHLLLRILRRIRENHKSENSKKNIINSGKVNSHAISAQEVSVIYVNKGKDGLTKIKQLRLAEDGEFIDRWPDGFFTERDKELFDEGFSPL